MIDSTKTLTTPVQSGEIQNLGQRQPPGFNPATQDITVAVQNRAAQDRNNAQDFDTYLNSNQGVSVMRQNEKPSANFDPVAEIEKRSALQGYGTVGQDQAV